MVRQLFDWVERERLSLGEVRRRLTAAATLTPTGKTWWNRPTIWDILKNPAYHGQAAFGKTRAGELRSRLREAFWISVVAHLVAVILLALSPKWMPVFRPVQLQTAEELIHNKEYTYLHLPSDAQPPPDKSIKTKFLSRVGSE